MQVEFHTHPAVALPLYWGDYQDDLNQCPTFAGVYLQEPASHQLTSLGRQVRRRRVVLPVGQVMVGPVRAAVDQYVEFTLDGRP